MLYIVATPIGHLADITLRALEVLKQVDVIAAEDTRHSQRLLSHYGIATPVFSLHNFNEQARSEKMLTRLQKGASVALISDAGTPLISDPGYRLVQLAHQHQVRVVPIPGACAAIAALSVSGLPTERFVFEGFLPAKGEKRRRRLLALLAEPRTMVFYESVHRIMDFMALCVEIFGADRPLTLARELTKHFETVYAGTAQSVQSQLLAAPSQQRGEFVVVVRGAVDEGQGGEAEVETVLRVLLDALSLKQAVDLTVRLTGKRRKWVYQRALSLRHP